MLSSIKHPTCSIQEEQQCAWPCKTIQPMVTEGIDGKLKIKLLNIFQTLEINSAGYTSGKKNSNFKFLWNHLFPPAFIECIYVKSVTTPVQRSHGPSSCIESIDEIYGAELKKHALIGREISRRPFVTLPEPSFFR